MFYICILGILRPCTRTRIVVGISGLLSPGKATCFTIQHSLGRRNFELRTVCQRCACRYGIHLPFLDLSHGSDCRLCRCGRFGGLPQRRKRGYPFYHLSHEIRIVYRATAYITFCSNCPISPNRTLVVPGHRITSCFSLAGRRHRTVGIVLRCIGRGISRHCRPSKCGVKVGIGRTTNRSMFRIRVRLVPHCGKSMRGPGNNMQKMVPDGRGCWRADGGGLSEISVEYVSLLFFKCTYT